MTAPIYNSWEIAQSLIQEWKDTGYEIVFTNGCFDILHAGHIQYLEEAHKLGDKLIIGLNSDSSVERLKGRGRPIIAFEGRAKLLAALRMVDMIIAFEEDTPMALIKTIIPDVLVKGGDYKKEDIVGSEVVEEYGGCVKVLSFAEGLSTSAILKKIIQNHQK